MVRSPVVGDAVLAHAETAHTSPIARPALTWSRRSKLVNTSYLPLAKPPLSLSLTCGESHVALVAESSALVAAHSAIRDTSIAVTNDVALGRLMPSHALTDSRVSFVPAIDLQV